MAGRTVPILLSAVVGIALGSIATVLLNDPPDHRGEFPAASLPPPAPPPPPAPVIEAEPELVAARQALAVRLRSPDALVLREVRVWAYGPADERAVCGTMQSNEIAGGSARFVVRVLQPRDSGSRPPQTVVEDAPWLVRPTPEAARRFCRDPQAEATAPETQAAAAPAPPAPPPAIGVRAGGRVTTMSPANLRAAPAGEVLMSIPRGRSLVVFDRAAGGWVQVGETAPEGWIHSSLLTEVAQ